jgi:hypothetical protein
MTNITVNKGARIRIVYRRSRFGFNPRDHEGLWRMRYPISHQRVMIDLRA